MGIYVERIPKCDLWRVDILILVTLGTNDKTFIRLIKEIERLIQVGVINEKVVVQAGYTKYESKNMEIFDLIPYEKFDDLISECNLLITHGGVGSIITGLKNKKVVIAVPRLEEYGEHVNNHQKEIIRNFSNAGYIIGTSGVEDLEAAMEQAKSFEPKTYTSNTNNMIALVREQIES